jgi:hypothetical protein
MTWGKGRYDCFPEPPPAPSYEKTDSTLGRSNLDTHDHRYRILPLGDNPGAYSSILASWVVSRFYAKASYEDNLKVFALKAAEKVTNLSNELDRLSAFLQKALDEEDFTSPGEELLAKTIRFEDAIHLITALRSVNDTSLSDWRGIIRSELTKQREAQLEEQEARESRLREIMGRFEHIQHETTETVDLKEMQERERILSELSALRGDMRLLASQVGGVRLGPAPKRRTHETPCPLCYTLIEYSHNPKSLSTKKVDCPSCHARLYATSDGTESVLRERIPIPEPLTCIACGMVETRNMDPLQGTMHEYECTRCHAWLRAVRSRKGVSLRGANSEAAKSQTNEVFTPEGSLISVLAQPHDLPEELLSRIADRMGPQPWSKGKSHDVRLELDISRYTIDYAIKKLISRGVFKPQVNGILYAPVENRT